MPTRPCWAEIRTSALEANYRFLADIAAPHAELLAIVKANAYGHSLDVCAPAVMRAGGRWLGVTSVEEGVAARALCPEARVLVIGGVFAGQGSAVILNKLTPVVWEPRQFDELERAARAIGIRSLSVHLEIDTGMLYETEPLDVAVFATVAAILLLVAAMACILPAWRASRLDPIQALRTE